LKFRNFEIACSFSFQSKCRHFGTAGSELCAVIKTRVFAASRASEKNACHGASST